ncbi:MAG: stress response translation initiation inhibitor YciH [Thermoplasmata archaeon]
MKIEDSIINPIDSNELKISVTKRRYGKYMTVIAGFDLKTVDISELATTLKRKTATGGTAKDGRIELQGDQRERVKKILEDLGYKVDTK